MKFQKNKRPPFRLTLLLPVIFLLAGCARPNDANVAQLLSETYKCQWLEVVSYEKDESLPGIWSYVVKYKFNLAFVDKEAGAKRFFQGIVDSTPGVTNWQKVFENPAAHKYIRENCSPPAQKIMEQIAIQAYIQMDDPSVDAITIPFSVPMTGWAEMTPGKDGWQIDMRRDKVDPNYIYTDAIAKTVFQGASQ